MALSAELSVLCHAMIRNFRLSDFNIKTIIIIIKQKIIL